MTELNESRLEEIRRRAKGALNGDLNYDPPVGDVVELIQMIDELKLQLAQSTSLPTEIEGVGV